MQDHGQAVRSPLGKFKLIGKAREIKRNQDKSTRPDRISQSGSGTQMRSEFEERSGSAVRERQIQVAWHNDADQHREVLIKVQNLSMRHDALAKYQHVPSVQSD